ncbi:hypothetical protein Taro_048869 [Colocasia esculenta]|uniref:non-specific serine/threonine protein kinase n=1 Tax=Colocasia esculenta TaxID=4460 RepID=A0A843X9A5_COLES|nr:hypothetical protein [Colocasia esculenta]
MITLILEEAGKPVGDIVGMEDLEDEAAAPEAFAFSDIVNATDNFSDAYCIGRGGCGNVFRAKLPTGYLVAVKCLHISDSGNLPEVVCKSFENEIRALTDVRHQNIVKLLEFCAIGGACAWFSSTPPVIPRQFSSGINRGWHEQ